MPHHQCRARAGGAAGSGARRADLAEAPVVAVMEVERAEAPAVVWVRGI